LFYFGVGACGGDEERALIVPQVVVQFPWVHISNQVWKLVSIEDKK